MKFTLLRLALLVYFFVLSFVVGRISAHLQRPAPARKPAVVRVAAAPANKVLAYSHTS